MSLTAIIVENYGPIALLTAFLYKRQNTMIRAIITLAEEDPNVDEEKIAEKLRLGAD